MNYTNLMLIGLGILGIFLHNLNALNKINKANDGNVNIVKYLKLEVFSILISFIVVFICILLKQEIKQLEYASKFLGVGFVAIGYSAQSMLVSVMGKANKIIGNDEEVDK